MAGITIPEKQPYYLSIPNSDGCTESFDSNLPVRTTDISRFQLKLDACENAPNIIPNGNFANITGTTADEFTIVNVLGTGRCIWYSLGGNYLLVDNQDTGSSGFSNVIFRTTNNCLQHGYYKLTLNVSAPEIDTTGVNELTIVSSSDGSVKDLFLEDLVEGDNEIYFWHSSTAATLAFYFTLAETSSLARIGIYNIDLERMPIEVGFGIENTVTGTTTVYRVEDYLDYTTQEDDKFTLVDEWLTVFIDWTTLGLSAGCYKFCMYDPCLNTNNQLLIQNGYLDEEAGGWTFSGTVKPTFQNTYVDFSNTFISPYPKMTSDDTLISGYTYTVEIDLLTVDTGSITLTVGSGSNTSNIAITNADSNTTVSTTLSGDDSAFYLTAVSLSSIGFEVDRIRVYLSDSDLTCNKESLTLNLGIHTCSTEVKMCHDEEDFGGFKFSRTGYVIAFRLPGILTLADDPFQYLNRLVYKNSAGRQRVVYGQLETYYDFKVDEVSEHIAKVLSLSLLIDHLYLDDTEYVVPSGETPQLERINGTDNLYGWICTVQEKIENIVNRATTAEGVGCLNEDQDCLLDPQTDLCVVDPITGEPVLSYE